MAYDRLEADAVLDTARRLQQRIVARFPTRDLGKVAAQLVAVSTDLEQVAARKPAIRALSPCCSGSTR